MALALHLVLIISRPADSLKYNFSLNVAEKLGAVLLSAVFGGSVSKFELDPLSSQLSRCIELQYSDCFLHFEVLLVAVP